MRHRILQKRCFYCAVFIFSFILQSNAQQIKVNGRFLSDSMKVGEEIAFFLSVRYPSDIIVLFPDSSFAFTPFEYQKRKYFPTETQNGISKDSTVYFLTTFELDSLQQLALPAYVLSGKDCTTYLSPYDTVKLIHIVAHVPDTVSIQELPLKANTTYHLVRMQFNTLLALIVVGVLLLLFVMIWIIFGKRILRAIKARKLTRKHREFMNHYNGILVKLKETFSPAGTESALSLWKKYMEQLEQRPYTKLTTRETRLLDNDERLIQSLRNVDMSIYGHASSPVDSLEELRQFADNRFVKKIEEVKNGK